MAVCGLCVVSCGLPACCVAGRCGPCSVSAVVGLSAVCGLCVGECPTCCVYEGRLIVEVIPSGVNANAGSGGPAVVGSGSLARGEQSRGEETKKHVRHPDYQLSRKN